MKQTKEVAIKTTGIKSYNAEKMEDVVKMSVVLKSYVVKQGLFSNIKGKNYVQVEGWQFAGGMLGFSPRVSKIENLSTEKEKKWLVTADIMNDKTNEVVSSGFALCSSAESKKKDFDEYAILSMAQTRAIGKAYRNRIGWIMKLAGYQSTPSEEMHKVNDTPKETPTITYETSGPEEIEDHVCFGKGCGNDITKQEAEYSKKIYGKPLCRSCQKLAKRK